MNKKNLFLKIADEMTKDPIDPSFLFQSIKNTTDDVWTPSSSSLKFIKRVRDNAKYDSLENNLISLQNFLILLNDAPEEIISLPKQFNLHNDLEEIVTSLLLFYKSRVSENRKKWIENICQETSHIASLISNDNLEEARVLASKTIKKISLFLSQSKSDVLGTGYKDYSISRSPYHPRFEPPSEENLYQKQPQIDLIVPTKKDILFPGSQYYTPERADAALTGLQEAARRERSLYSSTSIKAVNPELFKFMTQEMFAEKEEDIESNFYSVDAEIDNSVLMTLRSLTGISDEEISTMTERDIDFYVEQASREINESMRQGKDTGKKILQQDKEKIKQIIKMYQQNILIKNYQKRTWSSNKRKFYFKEIISLNRFYNFKKSSIK